MIAGGNWVIGVYSPPPAPWSPGTAYKADSQSRGLYSKAEGGASVRRVNDAIVGARNARTDDFIPPTAAGGGR